MTPTLETERLILRPVAMADAPRIAAFTNDPDVARMIGGAAFPNTQVCAEGKILIHQAREPLGLEHVFAIDLPGEGLIGEAVAYRRPGRGVEIGYWLAKPFWGQGFGEEAAKAVTTFAVGWATGPVRAVCATDNLASQRVLEKAGFIRKGPTVDRFSVSRRGRVTCINFELPPLEGQA